MDVPGQLDSQGVHSELVTTVIIGKGSTDGTFQSSASNVITTSLGTIVSAVNANGKSSIVMNQDGSVTVNLAPTTATSSAVGAGTNVVIQVPFPAQSFTWLPDPAACTSRLPRDCGSPRSRGPAVSNESMSRPARSWPRSSTWGRITPRSDDVPDPRQGPGGP